MNVELCFISGVDAYSLWIHADIMFNWNILLDEALRAQATKKEQTREKYTFNLRNHRIQSTTITMQIMWPRRRTKTTSRTWLHPDDSLSVGQDQWCTRCTRVKYNHREFCEKIKHSLIALYRFSNGGVKCDFNSPVCLLDLKGLLEHQGPVNRELNAFGFHCSRNCSFFDRLI